jgi:aspartyl-tRNA(Asn)/glutamyl-tRNA(Gln) amidotransferase subunit C
MFSTDEVKNIAHLARLKLTPQEVEFYRTQMGRVLEYVQELQSVKTDTADLVVHVPADAVPFRGDEIEPSKNVKALIANAPMAHEDHFHLPVIMESND